jgi:hypothetical protein
MNRFKKLFVSALALSGLAMITFAPVSAQGTNPGGFQPNAQNNAGIQGLGAEQDRWEGLLQVVRNFVNWMLGILWLIALIVLLYGGFQMVTAAGNEDRYNAGFKILKQSGIGLVFIGVAWFVVSIIFFLIGVVTG